MLQLRVRVLQEKFGFVFSGVLASVVFLARCDTATSPRPAAAPCLGGPEGAAGAVSGHVQVGF